MVLSDIPTALSFSITKSSAYAKSAIVPPVAAVLICKLPSIISSYTAPPLPFTVKSPVMVTSPDIVPPERDTFSLLFVASKAALRLLELCEKMHQLHFLKSLEELYLELPLLYNRVNPLVYSFIPPPPL